MRLPEMNHKKIQRIMKKYGLVAQVRRRNPYRAIRKKTMEHRIFPNKLQRAFKQSLPFQVFCTDITYVPFLDRFAYLSVVKDIASGEVMAWEASLCIDMQLVLNTMKRIPSHLCGEVMVHSDQGFHYTNPSYIQMVSSLDMDQSMSRKANCIDNAPIESFFGHMKDELEYKNCKSFEELYSKIEHYMQYYNHERKQWNKNKMTPVQYRNHLLAQVEG
jgi:putative transposase